MNWNRELEYEIFVLEYGVCGECRWETDPLDRLSEDGIEAAMVEHYKESHGMYDLAEYDCGDAWEEDEEDGDLC